MVQFRQLTPKQVKNCRVGSNCDRFPASPRTRGPASGRLKDGISFLDHRDSVGTVLKSIHPDISPCRLAARVCGTNRGSNQASVSNDAVDASLTYPLLPCADEESRVAKLIFRATRPLTDCCVR